MYRHYCNGEFVASSEMDRARKLEVWEVFEEYADIRDELEDLLIDFQNMVDEVGMGICDLADGLGELAVHLDQCDRTFRRFKPRYKKERETGREEVLEETEPPFDVGSQAL